MDRKNRDYILQVLAIIISILSIFITMFVLLHDMLNSEKINNYFILICILIVIELCAILAIRVKKYDSNNEIHTLNKLLEYSKKRKELEEEINLLTRELLHSSVSEYLDVNRLVFSGQYESEYNKSINYELFFKEFGIEKEKIEIRKNSAVFLTPFSKEGEELFNTCQKILGDIDIFLQKTDNYVEKEDIMMNIISLIVQSEIVIVNINERNANVYYELGIAHAIGKPTILISESKFSLEEIGFDIRQKRIIMYNSIHDLEKQLLYQVSRLKK